MTLQGNNSFGTGDINLAAAIMTMGVPPDELEPVKLISCENGKDYARFHIGGISYCGKYETTLLMRAWDAPKDFAREFPGHPFTTIMSFISNRPKGCSSKEQWLEHAAAFLGIGIDSVVRTYKAIHKTCAASPESQASYVIAFIANRFDLISAAKRQENAGRYKNMMTHGKALALIPNKARRSVREYLRDALLQ